MISILLLAFSLLFSIVDSSANAMDWMDLGFDKMTAKELKRIEQMENNLTGINTASIKQIIKTSENADPKLVDTLKKVLFKREAGPLRVAIRVKKGSKSKAIVTDKAKRKLFDDSEGPSDKKTRLNLE